MQIFRRDFETHGMKNIPPKPRGSQLHSQFRRLFSALQRDIVNQSKSQRAIEVEDTRFGRLAGTEKMAQLTDRFTASKPDADGRAVFLNRLHSLPLLLVRRDKILLE